MSNFIRLALVAAALGAVALAFQVPVMGMVVLGAGMTVGAAVGSSNHEDAPPVMAVLMFLSLVAVPAASIMFEAGLLAVCFLVGLAFFGMTAFLGRRVVPSDSGDYL